MPIGKILGKIVGIDGLFEEIGKTVRQVIPNPEAQREAMLELSRLEDKYRDRIHNEMLAQIEVNKIEAKHQSIFVAGWRPFIGWVCGVSLGYNFVVAPLLSNFVDNVQLLNIEYLIAVVGSMLGSSGLRTYEAMKGVKTMTLSDEAYPSQVIEQRLAAGLLQPTTPEEDEEADAPWNKS